jgi:hypothetical protein
MASAVLDFSPTAKTLRARFADDDARDDAAFLESDALLPAPPRLQNYSTTTTVQTTSLETLPSDHAPPPTRKLVREHRGTKPRRFELLQQWEGVVSETDTDTFWAELRDLTDPNSNREIVEIYLQEVADQDKPLVAPGAVFYWSIGYDTTLSGSRVRASEIKFRRTPRWSKRRLAELAKKAEIMAEKFLNAERPKQPPAAG